jgi:hypothetical protein
MMTEALSRHGISKILHLYILSMYHPITGHPELLSNPNGGRIPFHHNGNNTRDA